MEILSALPKNLNKQGLDAEDCAKVQLALETVSKYYQYQARKPKYKYGIVISMRLEDEKLSQSMISTSLEGVILYQNMMSTRLN